MQVVIGILASCCIALGVLHLFRLVVRRTDMIGEASHAAMAFGMAAMFSPAGDPVPAPVWIGVFGCCVAWFAVVVARAGSVAGEPGHHVVGGTAMLFMLMSGHPAHGGVHAGVGLTSVVAITLAGYFAWHVLRCADRLPHAVAVSAVAGPAAAVPAPAPALPAVGRPRTAAVAHIMMAATMTVMLLASV